MAASQGYILSLNYGELPEKDILTKAVEKEYPDGYRMELADNDRKIVTKAIEQGIDSNLEAVTFNQYIKKDRYNKLCLIIHNDTLHVLLRRLCETGEEEALDLVSCILETLDIEWI